MRLAAINPGRAYICTQVSDDVSKPWAIPVKCTRRDVMWQPVRTAQACDDTLLGGVNELEGAIRAMRTSVCTPPLRTGCRPVISWVQTQVLCWKERPSTMNVAHAFRREKYTARRCLLKQVWQE